MSFILDPADATKFKVCRRCKKRRTTEEPPEHLKFKTCHPCRILERKQKQLIKPSGSKKRKHMQDRVLLDTVKEPRSWQKPQLEPIGKDPVIDPAFTASSILLPAMLNAHPSNVDLSFLRPHQLDEGVIDSELISYDKNAHFEKPSSCRVCSTPMDHTKTCQVCSADPNVITDFTKYLKQVSFNTSVDINTLIYYQILHLDLHDANISEFIFDNYMRPVFESCRYTFAETECLDTSESIERKFKCQDECPNSDVSVHYNFSSGALLIKFSHGTHNVLLEDYTGEQHPQMHNFDTF